MSQLISVVIPAHNHDQFITRTIESLQQQDYQPIEIILVDDGSSDRTVSLAQAALARSGLQHQVITQIHQGAHNAINNGLSIAKGEWLSILNSDDRYHPQRLSKLLKAAERKKSRFVISRVTYIDADDQLLPADEPHFFYYNQTQQDRKKYINDGFELIRHNYAISTGNFLFHRSIFEQVGKFQPFIICHDWDFILRVLLVEEILYVNDALYFYRVHPGNTLKNVSQQLRWQEIDEVVSSYINNAEQATNRHAPCKKNYDGYWEGFLAHEIPYLINQPRIQQAVARYDLAHAAPLPEINLFHRILNKLGEAFR